jgi:hypothetical protein
VEVSAIGRAQYRAVSDPKNVRLYGILARESPRAVLFRRGPSKQVLVLTWDTETDKIEEGQWLKGRIYEHRCDLSPDGEFLIYFAGNQKPPHGTWTAISRPPYLTALALWPKGDTWGGGGLFITRDHVQLNHWSNQFALAEGFSLPKRMKVDQFQAGGGEDDPIWSARLSRDGWILISQKFIWEKADPTSRYVLRMTLRGMMERGGPWYVMDYAVVDAETGEERRFDRTDWADWSHQGDLLFTKNGAIYRAKCGDYGLGEPVLVMDLADRKFVNREAPPAALRW